MGDPTMSALPALPDDWEPTRATLHAYARAVGAPLRAFAEHPKWWHVSLKVRPDGLVTEAIPLPDGTTAFYRLDLRDQVVVFESSRGLRRVWDLTKGMTGTQLGDELVAAAEELGATGEVDRSKYENDEPRPYEPAHAGAFFDLIQVVHTVFTEHRNSLEGPVGPIQLWPHGFDLAFEWFGTRKEVYEEEGETTEYPSQINLGFYPGGEPYFYSNPWPFEKDVLLDVELPAPARWHTEGWEGSILPYAEIRDDPQATEKILAFAKAVFDAAAPTLTV